MIQKVIYSLRLCLEDVMKKLIFFLMLTPSVCFGVTYPNVVPTVDNKQSLGTDLKRWTTCYSYIVYAGTVTGDTAPYFAKGLRLPDGTVITSTSIPAIKIPTVYVCASDAPQALKNEADYVCDGTSDDVELNQASNYINSIGGGLLQVEGGILDVDATIYLSSNTIFNGRKQTTLKSGGTGNYPLITLRDGANYITITNIIFQSVYATSGFTGEFFTNSNNRNIVIDNCSFTYNNGPIYTFRLIQPSTNVWITNNTFDSGGGTNNMYIKLMYNFNILNNTFIQKSGLTAQLNINVSLSSLGLIKGNKSETCSEFIRVASNASGITVSDNKADYAVTIGYNLLGSSLCIHGNTIYNSGTAHAVIATNGNKSDINSWDSDNLKLTGGIITGDLIVNTTIQANTGNFQEVIVSTILGHSPTYAPEGFKLSDGTILTSTKTPEYLIGSIASLSIENSASDEAWVTITTSEGIKVMILDGDDGFQRIIPLLSTYTIINLVDDINAISEYWVANLLNDEMSINLSEIGKTGCVALLKLYADIVYMKEQIVKISSGTAPSKAYKLGYDFIGDHPRLYFSTNTLEGGWEVK